MDDTEKVVYVRGCQRCGKDHVVRFEPLRRPTDEYTWWGTCGNTGQPVLMAVREKPPVSGSPMGVIHESDLG